MFTFRRTWIIPALHINVNRARASELGLNPQEVVDNLITSLTSDAMIAPSYWVDPRSGNNYFVTVQYPENQVQSDPGSEGHAFAWRRAETADVLESGRRRDPWRNRPRKWTTTNCNGSMDIYVDAVRRRPRQPAASDCKDHRAIYKLPQNRRINTRGLVVTMQNFVPQFRIGLLLAILLVYLILVAQFSSFIDPFLIVLAVPTGLVGRDI